MNTPQTIIFYLIVFTLTLAFTRLSEVSGRPYGLIAATFLLILVSGLRAYNVGVDTSLYQIGTEYFFRYGEVSWQYSFSYGYGVFTSAVLRVCNNYTVLLVVQAFITNGLIAARFWDFRHGASLTFMMLGYLCTVYLMTLCIVCQFLAVAIVFYFSRFLDRQRVLIYIFGVALAAFLHLSAAISIVAVVPYLVSFKGLSVHGVFARFLGCIALGVGLAVVASRLINKYSYYNTNTRASSVGMMVFIQMFVLVGSLLMMGYFGVRARGRVGFRGQLTECAPHSLFQYVLSLGMSSASYVIGNAGRISYYFMLFGPVVFGVIAKRSRIEKQAFACAFLLSVWLVAYLGYVFFMHDGLGILSYSFIWNG